MLDGGHASSFGWRDRGLGNESQGPPQEIFPNEECAGIPILCGRALLFFIYTRNAGEYRALPARLAFALDVLFRQTGVFDKAFCGILSTDDGMSWCFFTNSQRGRGSAGMPPEPLRAWQEIPKAVFAERKRRGSGTGKERPLPFFFPDIKKEAAGVFRKFSFVVIRGRQGGGDP